MSDKYQIEYYIFTKKRKIYSWLINVKKYNVCFNYSKISGHTIKPYKKGLLKTKILNNFIIESELITMLKSQDQLTIDLVFEILNNKLNERTRQNTK